MSDFEARLAALEAREITVEDLPLQPLQRKLTQSWLPQASEELVASTSSLRDLAFGTETITFNANNDSDALTVKHGLEQPPRAVLLTLWQPGNTGAQEVFLYVVSGSVNKDTFQIRGRTAGGVSYNGQAAVSWLAFA